MNASEETQTYIQMMLILHTFIPYSRVTKSDKNVLLFIIFHWSIKLTGVVPNSAPCHIIPPVLVGLGVDVHNLADFGTTPALGHSAPAVLHVT